MRISLVLPVWATASVVLGQNLDLHALFGPGLSPGAEIFLPTWDNWTEHLQPRWTDFQVPHYIGAIKVATIADVQHTVKLASRHNIPFLATAAGHGVSATLARLRNGLSIDISNLRYVQLDETGDRITVGGSTKFVDIWNSLQAVGKETATGAAECVGALGATLGGGIGPLQGRHGLMIDTLLSVKVVTATGDLVTASKTENPDLFWGIRGAGWNFGIVVEATYEVYDATHHGFVLECDMLFPSSANRTIWETLRELDDGFPDILTVTVILAFNPATMSSSFIVNFIYFGPEEEAQQYLQPFYDIGPIKSNSTMVPWNRLYWALYFALERKACKDRNHLVAAGVGLRYIDVDSLTAYTDRFTSWRQQHPDMTSSVVFSRFSTDAVLAVPDAETSYPHRDIVVQVYLQYIFPESSDLYPAIEDFMIESRDHFARSSGFDELTVYSNYAHGDEAPETLYSARKLPQLVKLKKKWDPREQFSFYHPVPVRWP